MEGLNPETITKIVELADKASDKENRVLQIGGHNFDAKSLERIFDDPRPDTLEVSSLSAIADYVKDGLEGIQATNLFARIVSPDRVDLLESFSGDEAKRTCYMRAILGNDAKPYRFGDWLESEAFIVALMSVFEDTPDRATVLAFSSGLASEAKLTKTDSGATTKTQANAGVINTTGAKDPGVVVLKPFRTFRQIDQPESSFIFRFKADGETIKLALIEADGGAWKHEAMNRIAEYFAVKVSALKVLA